MKINNSSGEDLGEFFRTTHIKFYGSGLKEKGHLFEDGNVGDAILGLAIIEASKNIKDGLLELADALIQKHSL